MRISRPSTGTILGGVALFVALGGTALAATATQVNIADPTTPANQAKVDSTGALKTAGTSTVTGYVGETIPKTPFFGHAYIQPGASNTVIAANKATVALTRMDLTNYYDQTNGAAVEVRLKEWSGTSTTCDGSTGSVTFGVFEIPAGQMVSDNIGSPIVLKPLVSGDVWCLIATATVQGSPGGFYWPEATFSGYVAAGTLPAGAVASAAAAGPALRRSSR